MNVDKSARYLALSAALLFNLSAIANADEGEAQTLAAAAGVAERDGTRLRIHFESGKTKVYVDGPSCRDVPSPGVSADSCYGYELLRYDRYRGVIVVRRYYYEGADHILIDARTGEETTLQMEPNVSPNGDVVVELVYGESHYYAGNPAMNVWRRAGGKFVRAWSQSILDGDETYFSVLGWASNDRIDIEVIRVPPWQGEGSVRRFSIVKDGHAWRVVSR